MKKFFKYIKQDKLLFWSFIFSGTCIFISTACIAIFYHNLPPFLPIFNSLPWGYARVGSKILFFIPILITLTYIVINLTLSSLIYTKIVLLSRFIGATTLAASMSVLIFTIQILLLIH